MRKVTLLLPCSCTLACLQFVSPAFEGEGSLLLTTPHFPPTRVITILSVQATSLIASRLVATSSSHPLYSSVIVPLHRASSRKPLLGAADLQFSELMLLVGLGEFPTLKKWREGYKLLILKSLPASDYQHLPAHRIQICGLSFGA
ncbi:hypothetical protein PIB30_034135 [Stylosanthes scabra]|uniref:Uncharacterized protein n=1 Tax=Stylosanthes scabra TaxID=79078 RepID=A0ABU6UBF9_9FABA|nr:hypothetical protein [Stylosanthes scabra]